MPRVGGRLRLDALPLRRQEVHGNARHPQHALVRCHAAAEGSGHPARHHEGHVHHGAWRQHDHAHAGSGERHREARSPGRVRSLSDHLVGALRAQERHLPAAGLHQLRDGRIAHRLQPLAAMGRADRQAGLRVQERLRHHVHAGPQARLRRPMFKNIKVENGAVSAEDILREINRGGWSTGYCGQSPERLKAHMRNQSKFDVVTLRAPKDDPEVGGDVYGLPWPCWGTPEFRHPGTPILYNTNLPVKEGGGTFRARFGVERNGDKPARRRLLFGRLRDQGRLSRVHPRRAQEARLGQGPHRAGTGRHPASESGSNPDAVSWSTDLSGGIQRVAIEHGCSPYGNGKARTIAWNLPDPIPVHREPIYTPRPDLVAKYPTLPDARQFRVPNIGFTVQKSGRRQGHRATVSADPELRPAGRIRGRRRGDALQQVARRAEAGHVRRDQPGGCRRARHQGRRLGLGHRRRKQLEGADEGAGDRARRQGRRLDARSISPAGSRASTSAASIRRVPIRSCSARA